MLTGQFLELAQTVGGAGGSIDYERIVGSNPLATNTNILYQVNAAKPSRTIPVKGQTGRDDDFTGVIYLSKDGTKEYVSQLYLWYDNPGGSRRYLYDIHLQPVGSDDYSVLDAVASPSSKQMVMGWTTSDAGYPITGYFSRRTSNSVVYYIFEQSRGTPELNPGHNTFYFTPPTATLTSNYAAASMAGLVGSVTHQDSQPYKLLNDRGASVGSTFNVAFIKTVQYTGSTTGWKDALRVNPMIQITSVSASLNVKYIVYRHADLGQLALHINNDIDSYYASNQFVINRPYRVLGSSSGSSFDPLKLYFLDCKYIDSALVTQLGLSEIDSNLVDTDCYLLTLSDYNRNAMTISNTTGSIVLTQVPITSLV